MIVLNQSVGAHYHFEEMELWMQGADSLCNEETGTAGARSRLTSEYYRLSTEQVC